MITYQKLPKGTPQWLSIAILLLGGALGIAISTYALTALYGLSAFLVTFFFPSAGFQITAHEAIYLGILGVSAAVAGTLTSGMAMHMNGLSKKALPLSRIIWIPSLITAILAIVDVSMANFAYPLNTIWLIGICASFIFSAVLPWLILRTPAARKLHRS